MKQSFLTLLISLLTASVAQAGDINITAEKQVEWHQKAQKMVAVGNAVATKEDMSVKANTLTGYYAGATENSKGKITRVVANGNVRLQNPRAKAFGNNLDYDLVKDEAVLIGTPAKIDTGTETITAKEKIVYYPQENKAIATGNVTAVDKEKNTVYADRMVAYFEKSNTTKEGMSLNKIDIFDNVKIVSKEATVTADKGRYLPKEGLIRLYNNVTINQKGNVLHGDKAETNLNTGISKLISASPTNRVKGVFKEKKDKK